VFNLRSKPYSSLLSHLLHLLGLVLGESPAWRLRPSPNKRREKATRGLPVGWDLDLEPRQVNIVRTYAGRSITKNLFYY